MLVSVPLHPTHWNGATETKFYPMIYTLTKIAQWNLQYHSLSVHLIWYQKNVRQIKKSHIFTYYYVLRDFNSENIQCVQNTFWLKLKLLNIKFNELVSLFYTFLLWFSMHINLMP